MSVVVPGSAFQVSQVTGDVLSIVGFDVSLSQSDVPYQIVTNAPVAASSTDLLVYGDTVTITGDLVNPGRAIAIYARQIIVGATAFINVSGPDPVTTFAAGQPAEQTNTSDGAAGANGAPASSGLGAGTITLAAESIQTGGPDTGAGTPGHALCLAQLQTSSVLPSAIAAYQSAVGQTTLPLTLAGLADILTITDLTIGDVQHPTSVTVLPPDPQTGAYPVVLTFASLTMQGTVTLTAFGEATSGPLTGLCSATLTVPVMPSTTPERAASERDGHELVLDCEHVVGTRQRRDRGRSRSAGGGRDPNATGRGASARNERPVDRCGERNGRVATGSDPRRHRRSWRPRARRTCGESRHPWHPRSGQR